MTLYEMTRMPGLYLLIGVLVMLAIGQAAVLVPRQRAPNVQPVVVTKSA